MRFRLPVAPLAIPVPIPLLVPLLALAGAALAGCHSTSLGALPDLARTGVPSLEAAVRGASVVLVGEAHDDRAHHALQLDVLRIMHDQAASDGAPLALGMEQFQRPFQRHLDDYVAGRIDEEAMLRRTEYFDRWNMDFTLYAPLWRFCRETGVRVVGLNAELDVVRKVGRGGIAALDPEERRGIAEEIDLGVASHRERIMEAFGGGAHQMPAGRLAALYEAQTTWDETMAESAARALEEAGPAARMLVIAGSFHVQQRDGIPDRLARRVRGLEPLVVVARTRGSASPGDVPDAELGDFVVRLDPLEERERPWFHGLRLAPEPDAAGLLVSSVRAGSPAAALGFAEGDVITDVGDTTVRDIVDLRYRLDRLEVGDPVYVRVLRGGRPETLAGRLVPRPPAHTGAAAG